MNNLFLSSLTTGTKGSKPSTTGQSFVYILDYFIEERARDGPLASESHIQQ
jgi:hypothetical protein